VSEAVTNQTIKVVSFLPRKIAGQEKLRVALFLAEKCSGLESFLTLSLQPERNYKIVGALLTTPHSQAIPVLDRWRVPRRLNDIQDFYRLRGTKVRDLNLRRDFDRRSLELIADFEPACIALYGYIYILTGPILQNYPGRIINVHDSDLTIHDKNGRPRYCGLHATRDAIIAGETHTCSSVHLVTEDLDAGPMLAVSRAYPVHGQLIDSALELGAMDAVKAYAYAQREWMMRDSWPGLLDGALELLARKGASLNGQRGSAVRGWIASKLHGGGYS
jgi:folate-dependent phosphoribosylglycinamide formyltransferase PurN